MTRLRKTPQKWTLDLHGLYVEEAMRQAEEALQKATQAGIPTLELIHGSSTSSLLHANRTIKHALYERLDSGAGGAQIDHHGGQLL